MIFAFRSVICYRRMDGFFTWYLVHSPLVCGILIICSVVFVKLIYALDHKMQLCFFIILNGEVGSCHLVQILSSPSAKVVDGVEDDKFLEKLWVWLQVLVVAEVIGD